MTSLTIAIRPQARRAQRRVALARIIRSEFTKVRSVRSTYRMLFVLVLASITWCVAYCLGTVHQWPIMSAQARSGFDATQDTILGLALLGQLVIVVLGALMMTSEIVSFATSFATFFPGRILLASTHSPMALSQPGVLRALIVTALYVEVCGLSAFGIGALVRNTAGALTLAYGFLVLVPELTRALPESLHNALMRWVPGGDALNVMTATLGGQHPLMFSAWGELAVFAGYAAILLAVGAVMFSRRDA
jgi:ABC-2 type transport system permease protein